jgi:hypothetical protein
LRKKAGVEQTAAPVKPQEKPGGKTTSPVAKPKTETQKTEETPGTETKPGEQTQTAPAAQATPGTAEKPGKTNPWKLVDEWKGKFGQLEKELLEVRKQVLPEQDRKTYETRTEAAERRAKELEDEIRYVSYQKHPKFIKEFQEPYENAWKAATSELSEITIKDPSTNQQRVATPQDLMELVALPLGQAREVADAAFGPFSDDVMAHRKTIKELFAKQTEELKRVREEGATREKEQTEQSRRQMEQLSGEIRSTWEKVNAQALEDPNNGQYFKPKPEDAEWNQRLAKGFELADRAFNESPNDPRLTSEQRAAIVKRHAAVRNRAASWGAVKYENIKLKSDLDAALKELQQYKDSEPTPTGEAPVGQSAGEGGSATSRMMAELRKRAK